RTATQTPRHDTRTCDDSDRLVVVFQDRAPCRPVDTRHAGALATRHQNNRETADTRTYWTSPLRHRIQLSRWQRHPTRMGRTKPMTRRQKAHVLSFKPDFARPEPSSHGHYRKNPEN